MDHLMDIIVVNNSLLLIDYLKNKEYVVKKNKALFFHTLLTAPSSHEIFFTLNSYNLLKSAQIGHPYSLVYSYAHYIDYRDEQAVQLQEENVIAKKTDYEESQESNYTNMSHYFLNPIIYKNQLSWLDKIGALLYFTCGVKCAAKFHDTDHIKKFIPSNGARYPFKATIAVNTAQHVPIASATYYYDMRNHGLIKLCDDLPDRMAPNTLEIIYRADVARIMARYPNGVAYRDLVLDFGHLLATLKMCIQHYKLECFSLHEDNCQNILNDNNIMNLPFLQLTLKMSDDNNSRRP